MNEIFPVFPTPIGIYHIDIDYEEVKNKLKKYDTAPHALLEDSISSFGQDNNILMDEEFFYLRERIQNNINSYTESVGLQSLEITGSWYNKMTMGKKVSLHRHEGSVISGAFYIDVEDETVPLRFHNPLKPYRMNDLYDKFDNQYASLGIQLKPELGTLFLFPSWLEHETDAEVASRCVISFNTLYRSLFFRES